MTYPDILTQALIYIQELLTTPHVDVALILIIPNGLRLRAVTLGPAAYFLNWQRAAYGPLRVTFKFQFEA